MAVDGICVLPDFHTRASARSQMLQFLATTLGHRRLLLIFPESAQVSVCQGLVEFLLEVEGEHPSALEATRSIRRRWSSFLVESLWKNAKCSEEQRADASFEKLTASVREHLRRLWKHHEYMTSGQLHFHVERFVGKAIADAISDAQEYNTLLTHVLRAHEKVLSPFIVQREGEGNVDDENGKVVDLFTLREDAWKIMAMRELYSQFHPATETTTYMRCLYLKYTRILFVERRFWFSLCKRSRVFDAQFLHKNEPRRSEWLETEMLAAEDDDNLQSVLATAEPSSCLHLAKCAETAIWEHGRALETVIESGKAVDAQCPLHKKGHLQGDLRSP